MDNIATQTVTTKNGKELVQFDKMERQLENLRMYFERESDYSGFPPLPNIWPNAEKIYDDANEDERKMIFMQTYMLLVEAYRHWAVDLDSLWRDDGIEAHDSFIKKCKERGIWKKDVRNWRSFPGSDA